MKSGASTTLRTLFIAPHNDDEALFGSFTLLRHRPHVVVCHDSGPERTAETEAAMAILGCTWEQWPYTADQWERIEERLHGLRGKYGRVFAPALEVGGQDQHNHIARSAVRSFGSAVTGYLTYTPAGRSTSANVVPYELPWIGLKLRALACYTSQFSHPSHAPHFTRGLEEFYAPSVPKEA